MRLVRCAGRGGLGVWSVRKYAKGIGHRGAVRGARRNGPVAAAPAMNSGAKHWPTRNAADQCNASCLCSQRTCADARCHLQGRRPRPPLLAPLQSGAPDGFFGAPLRAYQQAPRRLHGLLPTSMPARKPPHNPRQRRLKQRRCQCYHRCHHPAPPRRPAGTAARPRSRQRTRSRRRPWLMAPRPRSRIAPARADVQ